MLTKKHALAMLDLQAQMNAKVNQDWLNASYPFLRAAVIEGAEAIEHHGWKWWKAQKKDMAQLQMELVDVWHFTLSAIVVSSGGNIEKAAASLEAMSIIHDYIEFDGLSYRASEMDTVSKLELLIGLSVVRRISIPLFGALLTDCGMSWDDLYRQYIGKNVLNFFRQDNGYKEGHYRKEWNGREDNEHLVEILAEVDVGAEDVREQIYECLRQRYVESLHGAEWR